MGLSLTQSMRNSERKPQQLVWRQSHGRIQALKTAALLGNTQQLRIWPRTLIRI
jgi:hypothetical protein